MSYLYPEALNAMEVIARGICAEAYPGTVFHVRVVADSVTGTASVDWSGVPGVSAEVYITINMPVRKATYRMSATEFQHWAAYLLHELGHPFETDKDEWKRAVADRRHVLLNFLEDVREEKATIDKGHAKNALKVFSDLIDMMHAKAVANGYDPNAVTSIGWTLATLGRFANGYDIDISDINAKLDLNGTVGKVVAWAIPELALCQSTLDCRVLADKVIAAVNGALKEERAKQPEPEVEEVDPEPVKPEPTGGMNENRDPNEPKPEPKDDEAEAHDPTPTIPTEHEPLNEERETEAETEVEVEVEEPEEELFKDSDIDEVDMEPSTDGNLTSSGIDTHAQRQVTRMLRRSLTTNASVLSKPIAGRNKDGSVDTVTGDASKMGRQRALLARAMKASDTDEFDGGRAHGRLNRKDIYKLATGERTIFGKRTMTDGYDTDVQILVDGSGSMAGRRVLAATSLALVVAQAAAQVGVDCYAHVFNDSGLHMMTQGKEKPIGRKFAYAYNQITGGTPLTENILLVAQLQHRRAQGKRRILFVITDGGCNNGAAVLKAGADYVESLGTEIANLHIGYEPMKVFRNEAVVNVNAVRETGLKQLTSVLEKGRVMIAVLGVLFTYALMVAIAPRTMLRTTVIFIVLLVAFCGLGMFVASPHAQASAKSFIETALVVGSFIVVFGGVAAGMLWVLIRQP